jgi:hypothetical protein
MSIDVDVVEKIVLAVYCVVGLPVVWLHVRQQNMQKSVGQVDPHGKRLVIFILAVMWPLLLLTMALTYFLEKKHRSKLPAEQRREECSPDRLMRDH